MCPNKPGARYNISAMINVDVCHGADRKIERGVDGARLTELREEKDATLWLDVRTPDEADWATLAETFAFHPLAIEDAQKQGQRPKLDVYDGYLFLTIRVWIGTKGATDDLDDATQEVDIFLGPNYLITIHNETCGVIDEVRRRWEKRPDAVGASPSALLHTLLDTVVDAYFPAMDQADEEIDRIETAVYGSRDASDLGPALQLKKRLMLLRQTVSPLRDVLNELLRGGEGLIDAQTRVYFQDVYDHALRLVEQLDLHRDILGGVMEAVMAQTSNRLNEVMKRMTAISTVLMSAGLITGVYGMNFKYMPETNWHYGYFGALAAMVGVATGLFLYFRKVRWF